MRLPFVADYFQHNIEKTMALYTKVFKVVNHKRREDRLCLRIKPIAANSIVHFTLLSVLTRAAKVISHELLRHLM